MKIVARQEIELAYYDVAGQLVYHYTIMAPPS